MRRFISDNCTVSASAFVAIKDFYTAYVSWCDDNGADSLGKIKFNERVVSCGYSKGPKKLCGVVKQVWRGLGLKPDGTQVSKVPATRR